MADNKKKFIVSLEIETKTAEQQIKASGKNIEKALAEAGKASDKVTYFKGLVEEIANVDRQLSDFKNKFGDAMFNEMFGKFNENIEGQLKETIGLTKQQLVQLDELYSKKSKIQQTLDALDNESVNNIDTLLPKGDKEQLKWLQQIVEGYKTARDAKEDFEKRKATGDDGYLKAVEEYASAAKQLKSVFDIGADGNKFGNKSSDYIAGQLNIYQEVEDGLLKLYNNQKETLSKIKSLYSSEMQGINDEIKKLMTSPLNNISDYDKLSVKLKELVDIYKKIDEVGGKDVELGKQAYAIQEEIVLLDKLGNEAEDVEAIIYDLIDGDRSEGAIKDTLSQLVNMLGIELPRVAEKAEDALKIDQDNHLDKVASGFTTITGEAKKASEEVQRVMYHIGNLFSKQGRSDAFFETMPYDLTGAVEGNEKFEKYGFGVLGGGLFGVTDPSTIDGSQVTGSKFVHAIDLSKYNMYIADTEERATNLMEFMSKLQKFAMKNAEPNYTGFDTQLENVNVDTLYDNFQSLFEQSDLTKKQLDDFIDEMIKLLKQAGLKFNVEEDYLGFTNIGELEGTENISTRFMKMLGYQGINVGTTSFDGLGQGSVLFDFEKTDIVGYFNTIESAIRDYQKISEQLNGNEWVGTIQQLEQYKINIGEIITRLKEYRKSSIGKYKEDSPTIQGVDQTIANLENVQKNIESALSGHGDGQFKSITGDENNQLREEISGYIKEKNELLDENNKLRDQINKQQTVSDDKAQYDDINEDIARENGLLEDKLELLREIADEYGSQVTDKKRERYEELNQKDMNDGLTSKEEERFSDLGDEIMEADESLERFGETYDKIIVKFHKGKDKEILPNDKGLRDLYKYADSMSYDEFGGKEIKDVEFVRKSGGIDDYLGTEIPISVGKANAALEEAENKFREFEVLADKVSDKSFYGGASDNVEIGKYIQQLNDAKSTLYELGQQGLLTSDQLESVNNMYNKAIDHLQDETRYYTGYGNYDYSYEYEYEEVQNENKELRAVQIEEATNKLQEFYELTKKDFSFLNDEELGVYRGQLDLLEKELRELHIKGMITDSDIKDVDEAYQESSSKIQTTLDENQKQRDIDSYYEGELYNRVLAAEGENKQLREDISDFIEQTNELRTENAKLRDQLSRNDEIDESSSDEITQLEKLEEKIKAVKEAVELKTQAFKDEGDTVGNVIKQEINALDALSTYLDTIYVVINHIVDGLNKINNTKLNDIVDNEEKAVVDNNNINNSTLPDVNNKWALDSTLTTTNGILGDILVAVRNDENTTGLITGLEQTIKELKAAANAIKTNADDFKQKAKDDAKDASSDDLKDTKKQRTFDEIKSDEVSSFEKYRKDVESSIHVTDEFRSRLDNLQSALVNVGDTNGLNAWKQSLNEFQKEFGRYEDVSKNVLTGQINAIKKEAKDAMKGLDLDTLSDDPEKRANQEKIAQGFKEIQIASDVCTSQVKSNQNAEIDALKKKKQQLLENINIYKKESGLLNSGGKSGKNYGNTAVIRETTRYNQLQRYADDADMGFQSSQAFNNKLQEYINAYNKLIVVREKLASKTVLTDHDVQEFNDAKQAAANYGKELDKMIAKSQKLASNSFQMGTIGSDIDVDNALGRKQALTDFVTQMHDANESTIKFSNNYQECMFKMKNSDGTWTRMTAVLDKTSNKMYSTAGEVTKYGTAIGEFVGALKGEFLKLGRYMIASFGFEEVIQAVRTGITYIKEIDDALTELKKVTNETDAGYDRFLQTMSKTAGVIGSTVAELTQMAAEWARLGYSISEAADLAESTAILLNVSEFEDATQASEALISTIQAFGYAAEESMDVVDIMNEIGNNYAVSSNGIAEALQNSASALMAGGNSMEEATAMIAAANKVVGFVPRCYSNIAA